MVSSSKPGRLGNALLLLAILSTAMLLSIPALKANAAVTTITAANATTQISINGIAEPGEWTAPSIDIAAAAMTVTFEQNSTGLFFLLQWQKGGQYCSDQYCFGGIEIGNLNNTAEMGSPTTPTIMVLLSQSLPGSYDEFVSEGDTTPTSVEADGYSTQSTCALGLSGTAYTAECYRPFKLHNASPYDPFPELASGSPIEIAFAVGEFDQPGLHEATDMSTYQLVLSTPPSPGQTSTSSSTTHTTSSTSTSTTTSSTISTSSTTTSKTSSTSSSSSTTTVSSTATSSSSTSTSPSAASSCAASTTATKSGVIVTLQTDSPSYVGAANGTISGGVAGGFFQGASAALQIESPSGKQVFSDSVPLSASGSFKDNFTAGSSAQWTKGVYSLSATAEGVTATCQFSYSPVPTTATSSSVSSVSTASGPGTTVTVTASPVTTTETIPATTVTSTGGVSTTTTTITSSSVPAWAYGAMILLLIVGFAVGFVLKGPITRRPAVEGLR